MAIERWKTIVGFECYQVSDHGRVRALEVRRKNVKQSRLFKPHMMTCPGVQYRAVTLWSSDGVVTKSFRVHELVACYFLPPKPVWANQVNHIDGRKKNCHYKNLEWSNGSFNVEHAYATGLQPKRKLTQKDVVLIKAALSKNYRGLLQQLAQRFQVSRQTIYSIRDGRTWRRV